jgi:hypothetical protein
MGRLNPSVWGYFWGDPFRFKIFLVSDYAGVFFDLRTTFGALVWGYFWGDPFRFKIFLVSDYAGVFFDLRTTFGALKSHQTAGRALELELKGNLVPQQWPIFRIIFEASGFGL